MVSSIDNKKQEKENNQSTTKKKTDIVAFLKSLANWVVGIVISMILYVSFSTAYYNYNNEEDLPTDKDYYPYAKPSIHKNMKHHLKKAASIGKSVGKSVLSSIHKKGTHHLTKMGLGKHVDRINRGIDNIKSVAKQASKGQRGGGDDKVSYFYRKKNSFMHDWVADILIYSWSSLRDNISEALPKKKENKSLDKASHFTKIIMFLLSPFVVKLGALLVGFIGLLRTFWGVFAVAPTTHALLVSIIFTIFPFPILAPIFAIMALVVGFLQGIWYFYFFGIKGFNASKPGTLKETGKKFANVITILLAIALMNASGYLSDGVANGVNIGSIVLIVLSVIDIGRKLYKTESTST